MTVWVSLGLSRFENSLWISFLIMENVGWSIEWVSFSSSDSMCLVNTTDKFLFCFNNASLSNCLRQCLTKSGAIDKGWSSQTISLSWASIAFLSAVNSESLSISISRVLAQAPPCEFNKFDSWSIF